MREFDFRNFDFNLLRALHVLLRERSVTRATDELNVTQQAMSGSLKRLRNYFDDPLLVRVGRDLELTPQALALTGPVRQAMQQIAAMLETKPVFAPERMVRHVRIAMSDHAALTVLPKIVVLLSQIAPGISFDVIAATKHTLRELDIGELDFCIMPENLRVLQAHQSSLSRDIRTLPLFEDRFVCVVDPAVAKIGATLSLERYLNLRHVALKMEDGSHTLLDIAWINAGISPEIAATAGTFTSLICMVPGTPLVATVHQRLAEKFLAIAPLRILPCPFPTDITRQQLHWHSRSDTDPTDRFLRGIIMKASETPQC